MADKADKVDVPTESKYSQIYEWLVNKLEASLNALYLVSSSRVESDLVEKSATLDDKSKGVGKKSKCNAGEVGLDDLEEVFKRLSAKKPGKESTIVNDFNLVGKLDKAEDNKRLYDSLKAENEKLLKKKDKLLDAALSSNDDKFNSNFSKILENVRSERATCEEQENICKVYATTTKLLNEMCNITIESCKDLEKNNGSSKAKAAHSAIVSMEASSEASANSTRDDLSV